MTGAARVRRLPLRIAVLLALLLVLAVAFGSLVLRGRSDASGGDGMPAAAIASRDDASALARRGAYLARVGNCMLCHTDRGGAEWAGGRPIETPFGTVYSSNITPSVRHGIGAWTADDFWRAMHHGRSREGRLLYPAFPYPNYTQITREDTDALFAFLRTVPPSERGNTPHALRWPFSTQTALAAWRGLYFRPGVHQDDPERPADWNRGAYLVRGLGHCSACHSTRNALGASDMMDLSGGLIPMQSWYAPSLSDPAEAGVAAWSIDDIGRLLATGVTGSASALGPMAEVVLHSTQYLRPDDLRAIAVFLKALPPAEAGPPVARPPVPASVTQRGAQVYREHCAQCHGARGEGIAGAYPALAGNRAVTMPQTANLVQAVIHGGFPPSTQGNPRPFGMPPFALVLEDGDVAAVLTYIRGAWGNDAGGVTELAVSQQRSTR